MRRTEAEFAEQRAHAYELRVRGLTYRDISTALNVPTTTIYRWCAELVAARVVETQTELLAIELGRVDRWQTVLEVELDARSDAGRSIAPTVAALLRLSERRCKLLGLDAAIKLETTVTEVTPMDLEVAELIREAQAQAAAEEARIKGEGT